VIYLPGDLFFTFKLNCSEIPNSLAGIKFTVFKNMFNVFTDIGFARLKKGPLFVFVLTIQYHPQMLPQPESDFPELYKLKFHS